MSAGFVRVSMNKIRTETSTQNKECGSRSVGENRPTMRQPQDLEKGGCQCCPVAQGRECCCPYCYEAQCWGVNAAGGYGLWVVACVLVVLPLGVKGIWWVGGIALCLLCPISIIWGLCGCSCLCCCRERRERVGPAPGAVEMTARHGAYDGGPVMAKMAPTEYVQQPILGQVYQPALVQPTVVTGVVVPATAGGVGDARYDGEGELESD